MTSLVLPRRFRQCWWLVSRFLISTTSSCNMAVCGKMTGWISADLFPTKTSLFVFITYMVLFINQGILVTASRNKENKYEYNTTTVVLLTECLKLVTAVILYLKDNDVRSFFSGIYQNLQVFLLYFVPSALYCLYNNLSFVNLASYDPTTYFLLLQFRVVVTGVIFQILFRKRLSGMQWLSLILLTVGCIIKEINHDTKARTVVEYGGESSHFHINLSFLLILLQIFCSCFAGVYNEYLLKNRGANVHIMMQNFFMYADSIVCNIAILAFSGDLTHVFAPESLQSVFRPKVLVIVFNMAGAGIITSLFLKNLNSILKTFASAMELMFTAVLCWIIFGISIDMYTLIAIAVVTAAIVLYSHNPVVNLGKTDSSEVSSPEKSPEKTIEEV